MGLRISVLDSRNNEDASRSGGPSAEEHYTALSHRLDAHLILVRCSWAPFPQPHYRYNYPLTTQTLLSQAIAYFRSFSSDNISIRLLVSYLLAVETSLTGYDVWNIAVHFVVRTGVEPSYGVGLEGSFYNLMQLNTILIVLVSTPVQCFYVWRLRALQNSWYLTILMYILSFISLVMGIVTAVVVPRGIPLVIAAKFIGKSNFPGDSGLWTLLPTLLWLGSSALVDVLVTGGLFYKLSKSRTGMKRTDTVVNSIIQLAIETGFLTSACIIAEIVLFLIEAFDKHGGLKSDDYFSNHGFLAKYVIADFALSKLYANTLLATLNARVKWRAKAMEADTLKTEDIFEV